MDGSLRTDGRLRRKLGRRRERGAGAGRGHRPDYLKLNNNRIDYEIMKYFSRNLINLSPRCPYSSRCPSSLFPLLCPCLRHHPSPCSRSASPETRVQVQSRFIFIRLQLLKPGAFKPGSSLHRPTLSPPPFPLAPPFPLSPSFPLS